MSKHPHLRPSLNLTVPPFDRENVRSWFIVIEAQFKLRNITDDVGKFLNTLAVMPTDVVSEIPSPVLSTGHYSFLKKNMLLLFGQKAMQDFVAKKPFHGNAMKYMEELQAFAYKIDVDDEIIRRAFLSAMPETMVPILAMSRMPLQDLALKADQLLPRQKQDSECDSTAVDGQMHIGISPYRGDQKPKICRGHIYFAEKSKTCQEWCHWPRKQNGLIFGSPSQGQ